MTITVQSLGQSQTFDEPGATFLTVDDQLEINDASDNTIAVFNSWDSVRTDAFDVPVVATAPVAGAPAATTVNPAPPEPTPHAPAATTVNPAPPEPTPHAPEEVPDTDAATEGSEAADGTTEAVTPETPLTPASTPSTSDTLTGAPITPPGASPGSTQATA